MAIIYVNSAALGNNDGSTPADAFTTIQAAVSAANPGDTVEVAGGDYQENVVIDKALTLQGDGRATTTITGQGNTATGAIIVAPGANDVTITGFTIVGIDNQSAGMESAAIYLQGAHSNINILDNEVVANGDSAILSEYGFAVSNVIIDGNTISGATFDEGAGVPLFTTISASQFTVMNVPRPLVYFGNSNKSGIVFSNNEITAATGGVDPNGDWRGTTTVVLDGSNNSAFGNHFAGTNHGENDLDNSLTLRMNGSGMDAHDNVIEAGNGASLVGGVFTYTNGDDWIVADGGSDNIDGLDGNDTLDMGAATSGAYADLNSGIAYSEETGVDFISNVENLKGGVGNDNFFGNDEENTFFATAGNDKVDGRGGNDTYDASADTDNMLVDLGSGTVFGTLAAELTSIENVKTGSGDDIIIGSSGDNDIDGGAGNDLVVANVSYAAASITEANGTFTISSGATGSDDLTNVESVMFSDAEVWLVTDSAELTFALANAGEGAIIKLADGTYEGNFTIVTDGLTIESANGDAANVVIKGDFKTINGIDDATQLDDWLETVPSYAPTGPGFVVSADDISLNNITITEYRTGIDLQSNDGLSIKGVVFDELLHGVYKENGAADVTNFSLTNSTFIHSYHGLIVNAAIGAGSFDGITVTNVLFQHLNEKGMYFEQLSNAELSFLTMTDVGQFGRTDPFGDIGESGTGIDINLKFGDYSNISIHDFNFTDVGISDGAGSPHFNGSAIAVKARDDGGSYGPNPATLDGVTISDGTIDGNSTGIRLGEPGKTTDGPQNVTIENVANTSTAVDAWAYDNQTDTPLNVTLTDQGDVAVTFPGATGSINYVGGDGADDITGGGANDTFEGGAGSDVIEGGAGIDTAVFEGPIGDYAFGSGSLTVQDTNSANGDEGTDTLTGIEQLQFGEGITATTVFVVGAGSEYANIQAAIDAAGVGDTIMVAAGDYSENLEINKALNFVTFGGDVNVKPAANSAVTLLAGVAGDVSFDGYNFIGNGSAKTGIFVNPGAAVGTLKLTNGEISGFTDRGIWASDLGTPDITPTLDLLDISHFEFSANGTSTTNTAHIKLFGFDGAVDMLDVAFFGEDEFSAPGARPDSAIEIIGGLNAGGGGNPAPNIAPDIHVNMVDVTVSGYFDKNPVAFFNLGEMDDLSISNLDLSQAMSGWKLFNIDGTSDSTIDASALGIIFPNNGDIHAELQGEKAGQDVTDTTIIGTASNDLLNGKGGNDTLNGGAGNDALVGGDGIDSAVGYGAGFEIGIDASGFWTVSNGVETDTLFGVESVTIDGKVYLLVNDDVGNGFSTVQAAIDAAVGGETILIAPGTYTESANYNSVLNENSGTNPLGLLINKDNITLQGVDADGNPISSTSATQAEIISSVQSNWGTNFLVTGDGVSILGLQLTGTAPGSVINKVIEVVSNAFTLQFSKVGGPDGLNVASTVYINDEHAAGLVLSDISEFLVDNNILEGSFVVSNGPGTGHPEGDISFVVSNNQFVMNPGSTPGYNSGILVTGVNDGVAWRLASAVTPEVTNNTFSADYSVLFRALDDDPAKLPDRDFFNAFIESNNIAEFAFVADANGEPKLINYTEYGADSNALYLKRTFTLAETDAQDGDTIVLSALGSVNVTVDGLTIEVVEDSGKVTLQLQAGVVNVALAGSRDTDIVANGEDNVIEGNAGDNVINGGAGNDTYVFAEDGSQYSIFGSAGNYTVVHGTETDTLISFEFVQINGEQISIEDFQNGLGGLSTENFGPIEAGSTDAPLGLTALDDAGDPDIYTVTNINTNGVVSLNGVALVLNQQLSAAEYEMLTYSSPNSADVDESIQFSVTDGGAVSTINVNMTVSAAVNATYNGTAGDDRLDGAGGNDKVKGFAGNDTLLGGGGKDKIFGGSGDDTIIGGKGKDILKGQGGSDTFVFNTGDGRDKIFGFLNGSDVLDLTAFGFANFNQAKSQFFEIGGRNDNKVGFQDQGTTIIIKGIDLKNVSADDVLI